jgi:gluconolactonase
MKVELLAEGYILIEGPRVDSNDNLWFSDIKVGGVFRRSPDGKIKNMIRDRMWIGGLAINADGRVVASGHGGLIIFDPDTEKQEVLLDKVEGLPKLAFNDIQPDDEGGLYAGAIDPAAQMLGKAEASPIVHLSPSRKARRVAEGTKIANGIGLSLDRKTLYQVETLEGVLAFDRAADGSLSNKRLFIEHRLADGLAVDSEDGIWIAASQDYSIKRFTPDGKLDRRVEVPVQFVTSLCFGGDDLKDIYIVTGSAIDKPSYTRTGNVYKVRSDVAGQPTPLTKF